MKLEIKELKFESGHGESKVLKWLTVVMSAAVAVFKIFIQNH